MDDRLKEALSAMMDDEADELAVHRVLAHSRDPQVRDQWQRWHQQSSLMHEQRQRLQGVSVDVSAAVRAAINDTVEPAQPLPHPEAQRSSRRQARGWASAAAVSLALLVGFGVGSQWQPSGNGALVASQSGEPGSKAEPENGLGDGQEAVSQVAIQELDDDQWDQVSRYLLEHAQHSSVGISNGSVGYARVASASAGVR
jgi:sigma-E factor negative regulatory protein RseA